MNMLVIKSLIIHKIEFLISTYFLTILNKRKWNDSYVQLSFTSTETTEGLQKPQYIVLYFQTKTISVAYQIILFIVKIVI